MSGVEWVPLAEADPEAPGITIYRATEPAPPESDLIDMRPGMVMSIVTNRGTWSGVIQEPDQDRRTTVVGDWRGLQADS